MDQAVERIPDMSFTDLLNQPSSSRLSNNNETKLSTALQIQDSHCLEEDGSLPEYYDQIISQLPDMDQEPWASQITSWMNKKASIPDTPISVDVQYTFSPDTQKRLEELGAVFPPFLWRTYSVYGLHHSTGISSPWLFMPSCCNHMFSKYYGSVSNLPIDYAIELLFQHIDWSNRQQDEFLSWTNSPLFAIIHATRRHEVGQRPVFISIGDPRQLKTVSGEQIRIYNTVRLLETFGATMDGLTVRQVAQEWTSCGIAFDKNNSFRHVRLEMLLSKGLDELFPHLKFENLVEPRTRLYTHLVAMRKVNFLNAKKIRTTKRQCQIASDLADLYQLPGDNKIPMHFHCFAMFLSLHARILETEDFRVWVREHYEVHQVQGVIYPDMHKIRVNLPELAQYFLVVKAACSAVDMADLPEITKITHSSTKAEYTNRWHSATLGRSGPPWVKRLHDHVLANERGNIDIASWVKNDEEGSDFTKTRIHRVGKYSARTLRRIRSRRVQELARSGKLEDWDEVDTEAFEERDVQPRHDPDSDTDNEL